MLDLGLGLYMMIFFRFMHHDGFWSDSILNLQLGEEEDLIETFYSKYA